MSYHLSQLKNISKNLRGMSHHIMPHHTFSLKNNSKIQENHFMSCHLSQLKNNSENSSSMPQHHMPCHLFILKNNSKKSRESPRATSIFSIKK
jgi:hypothetical protein